MGKLSFAFATALSALCVLVVAANITLVSLNRTQQADINLRQQYVQQSLQLEGLYREIVRALAELGARNNDDTVKALLQSHGITYSVNAPESAPGPAPAPAPAATAPVRK